MHSLSVPSGTIPRQSRYHSINRLGLLVNKNTKNACNQFIIISPYSNFVALWLAKVRKLTFSRIFFDLIGQETFTFQGR